MFSFLAFREVSYMSMKHCFLTTLFWGLLSQVLLYFHCCEFSVGKGMCELDAFAGFFQIWVFCEGSWVFP